MLSKSDELQNVIQIKLTVAIEHFVKLNIKKKKVIL